MEQDRADALMVSDEAEHGPNVATIVELAAKGRIPTVYPFREFVEVGGLIAYSIDQAEIYRRLANLIDKILRGGNPGDIPFYQPTKFERVSISRLRKRSASKCQRCCSAGPMR
jgi:putative ABC transport system substrate-binding protein